MPRKPRKRYSKEFRQQPVDRMKSYEIVLGLARELGVQHRSLGKWRDRFDPIDDEPKENGLDLTLLKEIGQLKRLLAEKSMQVDFFRGALQKIGARCQQSIVRGV